MCPERFVSGVSVLQARLDRALEGCGLSFAQFEVLEMLAMEPRLHAGELGRRLRITRQSAHGLLAALPAATRRNFLRSVKASEAALASVLRPWWLDRP